MGRAAFGVTLGLLAAMSGCSAGDGANQEDRHRLAVLRDDPVVALHPPGSVVTEAPSDVLATTDDVQRSGCCTSGVVQLLDTDVAVDDTIWWYVERLRSLGWQDIAVECRGGLTTRVVGYQRFDSFVGRFSAEVEHPDAPPHRIVQVVQAKYHTDDFPEPVGATPDVACLGS